MACLRKHHHDDDDSHLLLAFISAARRYWLEVFPRFQREVLYWQRRAQRIPDCQLRRLALEAQQIKRGNLEGATAFAAFAPRRHVATVVRAQVAFQAAYDYADSLAEQQATDPGPNANQLHQALLIALDPDAPHLDYYAYSEKRQDGGYLTDIVDACRTALAVLPSQEAAAATLLRFAKRIVAYQSTNLTESQGGQAELARWAKLAIPPEVNLRWWESAASAGSSLGIFALTTEAARKDRLPGVGYTAIERAYLWIGALHSLLDSLVDLQEDDDAGQRSLLHFYTSEAEIATRMRMLTSESLSATQTLPHRTEHRLILAAMVSHYLYRRDIPVRLSRAILDEFDLLARATTVTFKIRYAMTSCRKR